MKIKFNKYFENIILIIIATGILIIYSLINNAQSLEHYWIIHYRPVYDIINYTKIILKLTLAFNIKFVLFDTLSNLSLFV
jgi:hypothetical protein